MGVTNRRSKKRSGVKSSSRREEPTLFLDRNLGRHIIANRLRREGIKVEVHDDHLPTDAPDEVWIALVGETGWIALTKDRNLRYRTAEIKSVAQHAARIIVIRAKNATGSDIAELLVKGRPQIARFAAKQNAPFVAAIYRNGRVKRYPVDLLSRA